MGRERGLCQRCYQLVSAALNKTTQWEPAPVRAMTNQYPIVADVQFVQATRDTGYRSTALALAELVDNSLQAKARHIDLRITYNQAEGIVLSLADDGIGMDSDTLREALQFGGSPRFNRREGLGRFGMGLPNSSVSQARRVEVFTWRRQRDVRYSYLDLDEIVSGHQRSVPTARKRSLPTSLGIIGSRTGTIVVWRRCDRIDGKRITTLADRARQVLGRVFRTYIWRGIQIHVNGTKVKAIDPLFLHRRSLVRGATSHGRPLVYEVRVPRDPSRTSAITVKFSVLPVPTWHDIPDEEKRRLGIVGGAGVSVLRAGREIDYGWYFMGKKRKENYDDWWRCEVSFQPELDELFGVTHSKQHINPSAVLNALLSPDLEAIARGLNRRTRADFVRIAGGRGSLAERRASERDSLLAPLATHRVPHPNAFGTSGLRGLKYRIMVRPVRDPSFYRYSLNRSGALTLTINSKHPFFQQLYSPASQTESTTFRIDCLLLAAARAEAEASNRKQRFWYDRKRIAWSNALAAFLAD